MSDTTQQPYRIVVGFDGSEGSKRALNWAAVEAVHRAGKLEIVRAWMPGEFGSHQEMGEIAHKHLDADVEVVLGSHPNLDVTTVAEQGHTAKVLLGHGKQADMLVVGSRGHGGFAGLVLGSVGQQVATHASTPVVVVVRG